MTQVSDVAPGPLVKCVVKGKIIKKKNLQICCTRRVQNIEVSCSNAEMSFI
jgi:hypothetical protein